MIQPFHPVLPPPPQPPLPLTTNPQWEATKAKMALLNLSEAEITAALWRMPIAERELFMRGLIGEHIHWTSIVPPSDQAPLQVPYLNTRFRSIDEQRRGNIKRMEFAANLMMCCVLTVLGFVVGLFIWSVMRS